MCNSFLDEMAKEARNIVTNICEQQCGLADQVRLQNGKRFFKKISKIFQLLPKNCAKLIAEAMRRKGKNASASDKKAGKQSQQIQTAMPGDESYRRTREEMTV